MGCRGSSSTNGREGCASSSGADSRSCQAGAQSHDAGGVEAGATRHGAGSSETGSSASGASPGDYGNRCTSSNDLNASTDSGNDRTHANGYYGCPHGGDHLACDECRLLSTNDNHGNL